MKTSAFGEMDADKGDTTDHSEFFYLEMFNRTCKECLALQSSRSRARSRKLSAPTKSGDKQTKKSKTSKQKDSKVSTLSISTNREYDVDGLVLLTVVVYLVLKRVIWQLVRVRVME